MSEDKDLYRTTGNPFAGHSVNPVHGTLSLAGEPELDFVLDGPLPLLWQRTYVSGNAESGWLGQGWALPLSVGLDIAGKSIVFVNELGERTVFPQIGIGEQHYLPSAQTTLKRCARYDYELLTADGRRLQFGPCTEQGQPGKLPLRRLIDRNDHSIALQWRSDGLPSHLVDSIGRKLALCFEGQRLVRVQEVPGDLESPVPYPVPRSAASLETLICYRYNPQGDLIAVVDAAGNILRSFDYHEHIMVEHAEPGAIIARYEWDGWHAQGRVIRCTLNTGEFWSYAYDNVAGRTLVTDASGRRTTYHFDADKRYIGMTDAIGGVTARQFNLQGRLSAEIDAAGNTFRYAYDERGNLNSIISADGAVTCIEYHAHWHKPVAVTDAPGRTTHYAYDERGNLIGQTIPGGARTHYRLNEHGLPVEITDAHGATATMAYDYAQRLTCYTDSGGHSSHYAYDPRGNLVQVTDAHGWRTEYRYQLINRRSRLVAVKRPSSGEERYTYDKLGRLIAYRDALGHVTQYSLDLAGRIIQCSNALGHSLRYGYDVHGRLIALHNENNVTTRFAYDMLDHLLAEQGFDGKRIDYRYNAAGHLIESTEGPNTPYPIRTRYRRDRMCRLLAKISVKQPNGAHGQRYCISARNRYAYDDAGQLIQARNAAAKIDLLYDAAGQLFMEVTQTHDGRRSVLEHRYDLLGKRIETILPDGRKLRLRSYGSGHVHQIDLDGTIICDIDRNELHQEVRRTQGALASRYRRDGAGRLISSHSYLAGLESHPEQTIHSAVNNPQAGNAHLRYRIAAPSGGHISRRYEYDAAGQLEKISDNRHGSTRYHYDALGRLLSAEQARFSEVFAFDPAHNLLDPEQVKAANRPRKTSFTHDEWAALVKTNIDNPKFNPLQALDDHNHPDTWHDVKANQTKVFEDKRYTYDEYGNTTEKKIGAHTVQRFLWDAEHQLREASVSRYGRTHVVRYEYDALGRRIARQDESGTTCFTWDGNRLLLESCQLLEDKSRQQRLYIYEGDGFVPLAQVNLLQPANTPEAAPTRRQEAVSSVYYYHVDHLGTPREMTDSAGQLRWSASYKAWGNTLKVEVVAQGEEADAGPIEQTIRFQGQHYDGETGLHYNRFRYYDPDIGKFISQDPIGLSGGHNLYQYVRNPTGWVDPLGLTYASAPGVADAMRIAPKAPAQGGAIRKYRGVPSLCIGLPSSAGLGATQKGTYSTVPSGFLFVTPN